MARVVTNSSKFSSSKPLLERLHWLPLTSRINFKIATLTYKAINSQQPPSLAKLLMFKNPTNFTTRTGNHLQLQHPPVGTNNFGRRAFCYAAPSIWNSIPFSICTAKNLMAFRKQLKTYYFKHPPG